MGSQKMESLQMGSQKMGSQKVGSQKMGLAERSMTVYREVLRHLRQSLNPFW